MLVNEATQEFFVSQANPKPTKRSSSPTERLSQKLIKLRNLRGFTAPTRKMVRSLLQSTADMGFCEYMLIIEGSHSIGPRHQLLMASNESWVKQYANMEKLSTLSIITRARQQQGMIRWADDISPAVKRETAQTFHGASSIGKAAGATFSKHFGSMGTGILIAMNGAQHGTETLSSDLLAEINHQFVQAVEAVALSWGNVHPQIRLSTREYQTIYWAAHGKSSQEAAKLMNIAEVTVRYHLKAVRAKLQTSNKTESVAKAIALGLIQY